jgi:hypothetical protein
VRGGSVLLKGTLEERLRMSFITYDLSGTELLSKENMITVLCEVNPEEDPSKIQAYVSGIYDEMRYDQPIDYRQYRQVVSKSPALLSYSYVQSVRNPD